jgi:hypothetical protein
MSNTMKLALIKVNGALTQAEDTRWFAICVA